MDTMIKIHKKSVKRFAVSKINRNFVQEFKSYTLRNMTTRSDNDYCLILAGGKGQRLWPYSRESYPKQFIDFFGTGRTQLQQTYDRMARLVAPGHIFVSTNIDYVDLVRKQLPEVARDHILAEPVQRNTAPSLAWAAYRIAREDAKANIVTVPSDQAVMDEAAFERNVHDGFAFVSAHEGFLVMGVKPTRPEPGYGYIQLGDPVEEGFYTVKSFTEKPERQFAQVFMDSGEFYWNTGVFFVNVKTAWEELTKQLPVVLRQLDNINFYASPDQEESYMLEHFPSYPNLSIESATLEKAEHVHVMRCSFGWADLGTWHSMYESQQKTGDDNVVVGSDVMIENSRNNIIKLPKDRLGVISGLDGFIVAEKDNVLLICKKEDSSALIRKYVNEVALKKGESYV